MTTTSSPTNKRRKNVSAIERLRTLPELFRGADTTVRFGWDTRQASQYLHAWKKRGLISALGGHSDVYANTMLYPRVDWSRGAMMAMPSAVCIGVEPLRLAGWATQIQQKPDIGVHQRQPYYKTDHFNVIPLPAEWRKKISDGLHEVKERGSMPVLRPAWALVDMIKREGWEGCGLDPDDIDWEHLNASDWADLQVACATLDLDMEQQITAHYEPDVSYSSSP